MREENILLESRFFKTSEWYVQDGVQTEALSENFQGLTTNILSQIY